MTGYIEHHLTEDQLLAYSAGTLPEALSLLIACHVSLCDSCRATLESFDALGGALLEDTPEPVAQMSSNSLDATLALIKSGAPVRHTRRTDPVFPSPLAELVGGGVDAVKWRRIGLGSKQAIVSRKDGWTARLLHIPAGVAMPDHGHGGTELTLVLQGAFLDEDERFARGDVEIADTEVEHTPVADIGEDCICLAVTDAPLRFNGLIPKMVQPFLRI